MDKALTFIKDHFLMDGKVSPLHGQPLLVKSDVTYTRITVHETHDVLGTPYRVMFLATGGVIWGAHRVTLPPSPWLQSLSSVPHAPQTKVSCTRQWNCVGVPTSWRASSSLQRQSR